MVVDGLLDNSEPMSRNSMYDVVTTRARFKSFSWNLCRNAKSSNGLADFFFFGKKWSCRLSS